jgi:type IV secretion system protein VirD4
VLDPWGIAKGNATQYRTNFNPLDAIIDGDRRSVWSKAKALADAFGVVKQNDHWQNRSKQLLTALIAHVCTAENLGKPRDLVTVRELLMENFRSAPEVKAKPATLRKGEEIRAPSPVVSTIEAMLANAACEGAIRREASGIKNGAEDEVAGVTATAQVATEFIDESYIRESLRGRAQTSGPNPGVYGLAGLDFQGWRQGIMSVYLCVPARVIRDYPNYVRLVTVAALDTMLEHEEMPSGGPVQFILDELGYIGKLESVVAALGLGRSFGIQLWGVFQNVGMIRDDYGPNGVDTFWSNSGVRIVFSSTAETSDYASRQTGGATVTTMNSSQSQGPTGASSSEGTGETARPLLTPHEVTTRYAADTGRALVFLDGLNVAAVERLVYLRDEPFVSLADKKP